MLYAISRRTFFIILFLTLVSSITVGVSYAASTTDTPAIEWSRQYGMDEQFVRGSNIASSSDGGYIVTGNFSITSERIYILKLNAAGKIQWEQKMQQDKDKFTSADSTMQTKDGGFLVIGSSQSGYGKHNILLIKLTAQGAIEWEKEYDPGFSAYSLASAETKDGGFVITGQSFGGENGQFAFVFKADAEGKQVWIKKLKYSDEQHYADIIATPDGGSIAVGGQYDYYFNDPNKGALITKLNANGDELWTTRLTTPNSLREASSIVPSREGGYVVYSKSSRDDQFLTQIDADGNILGEKKLDITPESEYYKKIYPTDEGYALLSEYIEYSNVQASRRYELLKVDPTGKTLNKTHFTVKGFNEMTAFTTSKDGGIVLLGGVKGTDEARFIQVTKLAGPNSQPGERTVELISFEGTEKSITVGEHTPAIISATYSDGTKEVVKDSISLTSDDNSIAAVDANNFITGIKPGNTTIYADFKGQQAKLDIQVTTNPNLGDAEFWSYQYGKDLYYFRERSILSTSDGGYILTADTKDSMYSNTKASIIKLNAQGNLEWQQKIQHGFAEYTEPIKAIEARDGSFVISGVTTVEDERTRNLIYLAKLTAQGHLEWEKAFDGGGHKSGDSLDETTDGGFVVTGATLSISGADQAYVLKTDANGQLLWHKKFQFESESNQNYNDIKATSDGGAVAVGTIKNYIGDNENDRAIVTKLSPSGDEVWTKKFLPIGREAYSVITTKQNQILVASRGPNNINYLTLLDASGEVIWEKTYETLDGQYYYKILPNGKGYILFGKQSTGSYPNTQTKSIALKLNGNGEITDNIYFADTQLANLDVATATNDGNYVLMGPVKVSGDKFRLQVTKTAGSDQPPADPVVTDIFIPNPKAKLVSGEQTTVYIKARYSDGTEKALKNFVSFSSEDENIATVDSKGVITGTKPGNTIIHALYQGHEAQLQVEVRDDTEGTFYLDSEEYSLTVGTSIDTVAYFKDKDGNVHKVTKGSIFTSENAAVVDYDKDGVINGVRAGITHITAEYHGKTYKAEVQVVRDSVPQ
ncbi:hypothetical protein J2Z69_001051 [Paenibacillus shirakamiensis]|uniref:BIG2 domain-containing protein n=1 Tax=Paenibacillus shirakamiensis TaxID=1265935 RepID=A0ABS4JE95_9BACL|nr:hypothetical protein [Paenibacillus shirakamiensis]MBP2000032.1 hypothetical protein [Paenibacillus shirakamiensis]